MEADTAYFTIFWSKLKKAEKYDIIKAVPSVGGIYELYYMDLKGKLNLLSVSKAWFGGLRNEIRKESDPDLVTNVTKKRILNNYECYYRFSTSESHKDMTDILYFFKSNYFPGKKDIACSGRYKNIYVKEISPDKIVTI